MEFCLQWPLCPMAGHKEGSGMVHLQNIRGPQRADVRVNHVHMHRKWLLTWSLSIILKIILQLVKCYGITYYEASEWPMCLSVNWFLWWVETKTCVNIGRETLLGLCSQARIFPTVLPCQLCGALSLQGANLRDLRIIQPFLVKQPHTRPPAVTDTSTQSFLGGLQFYNIPLEFF